MVVLDRAAAASVLPSRQAPEAPVEALTAREQQVLQLLASGLSNKLIAVQLGISEHTAKFHVNSILGKLGAQSRAEAVAQAVRLGMILL
jgi:DNA-binding CsgD family transcriptional regulator